MPPLLLLIFLLVLLIFYTYITTNKTFKYWEKKGVSCPKPTYLFGNLVDVIFLKKSIVELLQSLYHYDKNARYIGCYQFFNPTLLIRDPDLIKEITIKSFDYFPDHTLTVSKKIDPFWGYSLIMQKSIDGWSKSRAKITSSFTPKNLRVMIPLMQDCVQNLINFLKSKEGTVTLEMKDTFSKLTSDIITSVVFGVSVNSLENEHNECYTYAKKGANLSGMKSLIFYGYAIFPKIMEFFRIQMFSKDVTKFFGKLIQDTVRIRKEKNILRPSFIQFITKNMDGINKNFKMSIDEITAHCLVFIFAGFESVSTSLCFAVYELALNPDIQNKMYNEITNQEGNLTYELISEMKYTDSVISELLRLHPPNYAFDRKSAKSFIIQPKVLGEVPVYLKKNSCVWIPIREIHRDPKNFPNPEKFDPERFNPENIVKIKPNTYMPFGSGPRSCIANRYSLLKLKVVLIELMKHYEFIRVEKTEVPLHLKLDSFFLVPKNGLWIGLKPRVNL